jgi:hypothetical protein
MKGHMKAIFVNVLILKYYMKNQGIIAEFLKGHSPDKIYSERPLCRDKFTFRFSVLRFAPPRRQKCSNTNGRRMQGSKPDTCWSKTQPVAWPHCSEYLEGNPAGCCYHQRQSIAERFRFIVGSKEGSLGVGWHLVVFVSWDSHPLLELTCYEIRCERLQLISGRTT